MKTNPVEEYKDDEADETLSLSDLQMDETDTTRSEEVTTQTNFLQEFFGFDCEEWTPNTLENTSPRKLVSSTQLVLDVNVTKPTTTKKVKTNPVFRSNSGSFKYMRFKMASSTSSGRSKSLSVMASKSKSRWQVFLSGFGSSKFPTKMDLDDIKSRQLRSESTTNTSQHVNVERVSKEEASGGRRTSGMKVWWRLVDVLGCGGGYEKDNKVAV
ncbi:hypothetical protein CTI12_AA029590 [Artemisia annua]|uniref:Uncharacterized protein n=1 Tax=Artemisia annua TaxID=35608 RepID=A0A2U1QDA3_ARTAN|nr:hypothetical protein CTI12_AA029590 [Artemisia annua]